MARRMSGSEACDRCRTLHDTLSAAKDARDWEMVDRLDEQIWEHLEQVHPGIMEWSTR